MYHEIERSNILVFITGKKSLFTVDNIETGNHITYSVDHKGIVRVLTSGDTYRAIGKVESNEFTWFKEQSNKHQKVVYGWLLKHAKDNTVPNNIRVLHHGICCNCGRTLTTPQSIMAGIGPECSKRLGLV
jgi:hypothetical protein